MRKLVSADKVVAVGETGFDFHEPGAPKEKQQEVFESMICLAREANLPLIIHSRNSTDDMLEMIKKREVQENGAVMHCFSGDKKLYAKCLDRGLFFGIGGVITFPNAGGLREVAAGMPVERMLLETDAPYLAPQKFRGKRNEPSYIPEIAEKTAEIAGLTVEKVASATGMNALYLFNAGVKAGKIAYELDNALYLNITNRCTGRCVFCALSSPAFAEGHEFRIGREPSVDRILKAVGDPSRYREIVFCGYGEPLIRLSAVMEVSLALKAKGAKIRVDTSMDRSFSCAQNIYFRM